MNYNNEILNSKKYNILDYFDFFELPNEDKYNAYYHFCRENLNIQTSKNYLEHSIFLFTESFEINAQASLTKEGVFVIKINKGLIQNSIKKYFENQKINQFVKIDYSDIVEKIDNQINILAFQLILQFTYYHELAHLFQLSKKKSDLKLQERNIDDKKFNIINHKLEINADTYSTIAIASHILQYIEEIFGSEVEIRIVNDIIKILGAFLLEYLVSFSSVTPVYLKCCSHPHPVLRMLNIVTELSFHLKNVQFERQENNQLDKIEHLNNIFDFYNSLVKNGIFDSKIQELNSISTPTIEEILNYLIELKEFDDSEYFNAIDFWDKDIV
ncbi:hypothetical protein PQG22_07200 [Aquirufa beregesia]